MLIYPNISLEICNETIRWESAVTMCDCGNTVSLVTHVSALTQAKGLNIPGNNTN